MTTDERLAAWNQSYAGGAGTPYPQGESVASLLSLANDLKAERDAALAEMEGARK